VSKAKDGHGRGVVYDMLAIGEGHWNKQLTCTPRLQPYEPSHNIKVSDFDLVYGSGTPYIPVLNDILLHMSVSVLREHSSSQKTHNTTDTVLFAKSIEQNEQLKGIGDSLLGSDDLDGKALVEVNGDVKRSIRSLEGADSASPTCCD
jgi:hypothetical protein